MRLAHSLFTAECVKLRGKASAQHFPFYSPKRLIFGINKKINREMTFVANTICLLGKFFEFFNLMCSCLVTGEFFEFQFDVFVSDAVDFVLWCGRLGIWLGICRIQNPANDCMHKAPRHKNHDERGNDHDEASNGSAFTCWRSSEAGGG